MAADENQISVPTTDCKWVVYSTFSASGGPTDHVAEQLRQYKLLGFTILLIDTSPLISSVRSEQWELLADAWFQRPNVGYDFSSYRAGLQYLVRERRVSPANLHLLIANDSCFGPFFPLKRVFDSLDSVPPGSKMVFGMTDSHEIEPHLQSYWIYFRPEVCQLAFDFFSVMPDAVDRDEAIRVGELGLSRFLVNQGCRLIAYVAIRNVVSRCSQSPIPGWALLNFTLRRVFKRYKYGRGGDGACIKFLLRKPDALMYVNQTHDFASVLHIEELSPFIKRSFFRSNQFRRRLSSSPVDADDLTSVDASRILRASCYSSKNSHS